MEEILVAQAPRALDMHFVCMLNGRHLAVLN